MSGRDGQLAPRKDVRFIFGLVKNHRIWRQLIESGHGGCLLEARVVVSGRVGLAPRGWRLWLLLAAFWCQAEPLGPVSNALAGGRAGGRRRGHGDTTTDRGGVASIAKESITMRYGQNRQCYQPHRPRAHGERAEGCGRVKLRCNMSPRILPRLSFCEPQRTRP